MSSHIEEVLRNVDDEAIDATDRERLRLVALTHDTFKHRVDRNQPPTGENHHAMIARRFAERFLDDPKLLDAIELHDEAFNSWVTRRQSHRLEGSSAAGVFESLGAGSTG